MKAAVSVVARALGLPQDTTHDAADTNGPTAQGWAVTCTSCTHHEACDQPVSCTAIDGLGLTPLLAQLQHCRAYQAGYQAGEYNDTLSLQPGMSLISVIFNALISQPVPACCVLRVPALAAA